MKPNLFIIGSMKSGTTSLHNYLSCHPDIYMADEKEPGYFVKELAFDEGPEWYMKLFEKAPANVKYIGESSTHYTKLPTFKNAADRMYDYSPHAKLIYIMRDPVKRAISHYWFNTATSGRQYNKKFILENRDMWTAITNEPEYIAYGDYAMQLQPYIDLYGLDNIYTLTFEELIENPYLEVTKIFKWLSLRSLKQEEFKFEKFNATPKEFDKAKGKGILHRLRNNNLWNTLSPYIPRSFRKALRNLAVKKVKMEDASEPKVQEYLSRLYIPKIQELSSILNREFPEWKSLK